MRYENLHYEVISERPKIYYYPNFLSNSECDKIRTLGRALPDTHALRLLGDHACLDQELPLLTVHNVTGLPHVKPSKTDAGLSEKVRSSTSYFFSQEQERAGTDARAGRG